MAKKKYLKFIKGQHSDYKVTNGLKKDKKKKIPGKITNYSTFFICLFFRMIFLKKKKLKIP